MLSRRFDRAIFTLALPALGALAADPLVSLVDTAFVGRLGARELAALGVNASLFGLMFFAFNFLAYGTTPRVGRALGRGDPQAAGRVVVQALFLAAVLGVAASVTLELFARPLLTLMGAGGELTDPALVYLRIRALAGPALLFITAGNGAFRGFQDTRTPLVVTLAVSAANLVLDPLLMFGFGLGLAGAAWATLIAQWSGALWFLWLLLGPGGKRFGVAPSLPRLAELRPFLRVGWELLIRTSSLLLTLTLATAIAARVGVVEVAAHQVASQLWLFLALVVDALAIAAQALVARYLGEGREADARAVGDRLLGMGLLFGAGLGAAFWLGRGLIAGLFASDATVVAQVLTLMPFIALMQPLNALVFVWDGIFMGIEDFAFLARAMVIASLAAALVLALVLPLDWGLAGVWWGVVTLMGVRAATLAGRYRSGRRLFAAGAER